MIGVFGGTFDPIHLGHLRPALEVMEGLALSEMRFIPGAVPPHRDQPFFSAEQRAKMVSLAIEGQAGFRLDRREIERSHADRGTPSYTVETLESLREELGDDVPLFLLLGTDAFLGLQSWHRWEEISALSNIVVMTRPGYVLDKQSAIYSAFEENIIPLDGGVEEPVVTPILVSAPKGKVIMFPVTQLDVSATDIRKRLQNKESVRYLVPSELTEILSSVDQYATPR